MLALQLLGWSPSQSSLNQLFKCFSLRTNREAPTKDPPSVQDFLTMKARKVTPVDIIYDRYNPIVVYEVTPESRPDEGGMTGIEEPGGSSK